MIQMIVSCDDADVTWQIHLDGFLAMLEQPPSASLDANMPSLWRAASHLCSSDHLSASFELAAVDDIERACLLLDIAKLRLRRLLVDVKQSNRFSLPLTDLQSRKLRVQLQYIHRGLLSVTATLSAFEISPIAAVWNQYRTVAIVIASLRLDIHRSALRNTATDRTTGFSRLQESIHTAAAGICMSASLFETCYTPSRTETDSALPPAVFADDLAMIWPLFCVSIAHGVEVKTQQWCRHALWRIGARSRLPKAFHLVGNSSSY